MPDSNIYRRVGYATFPEHHHLHESLQETCPFQRTIAVLSTLAKEAVDTEKAGRNRQVEKTLDLTASTGFEKTDPRVAL